MSDLPHLDSDAIEQLIDAMEQLGDWSLKALKLLRQQVGRAGRRFNVHDNPADQLRSDLQTLNGLALHVERQPALAFWLAQVRAMAQMPGTKPDRLLIRLRNRVLGKKETVAVRYVAPTDRLEWVAQIKDALGVHPDFDFEVAALQPGEIPDLVFLLFGARIDDESERLAGAILEHAIQEHRPPLLLLRAEQPDWEHPDEAARIQQLAGEAARLNRATQIAADSDFFDTFRRELPTLLNELDNPRTLAGIRDDRRRTFANSAPWLEWVGEARQADVDAAKAFFDDGKFDLALRCFRKLEAKLLQRQFGVADDKRYLARTRIGIAKCLTNLQNPDAARVELAKIKAEHVDLMSPADCASLAGALIWTGQVSRAESLIPAGAAGLQARRLLAASTGELDTDALQDQSALTMAANVAIEQRDYERLADLGLRTLNLDQVSDLSRLFGVRALILALHWTILDSDQQTLVPIGKRELLIDRVFAELPVQRPPHASAVAVWESTIFPWRQLTSFEAFTTPESLRAHVEPIDAPWLRALGEVRTLVQTEQEDQAFAVAKAAAEQWPERQPLQLAQADLLVGLGRPEAAFEPAQQAYRLFPGPRERTVLGKVLLDLGRVDDAWLIAHKLERVEDHQAALIYALASANQPSELRVRAWQALHKLRPDDEQVELQIAGIYEEEGRIAEAQAIVLDRLAAPKSYSLAALARIAALLLTEGSHPQALLQILERLKAHDGDRDAERLRQFIWRRVGEPPEHEPDWAALTVDGRRPYVPMNEPADAYVLTPTMGGMIEAQLYRTGRINLRTLLEPLPEQSPPTLGHFVERVVRGDATFSLAMNFAVPAPKTESVSAFLTDAFSLHLVVEAAGAPMLERLLADGRQLLIFSSEIQRLERDRAALVERVEPVRLPQLIKLKEFLSDIDPVEMGDDDGRALISDRGDGIDIAEIAHLLVRDQWVQGELASELESWSRETDLSQLPLKLVIGHCRRHPDRVLAVLKGLQAARRRLLLPKSQRDGLRDDIAALDLKKAALMRALRVSAIVARWRKAGLVEVIDEPDATPFLPPASDESVQRNMLIGDLAYREVLIARPHAIWLGADFLPFAWFLGTSSNDMKAVGDWTRWTPDKLSATLARYRAVGDRMLPLGAWARHFGADDGVMDRLLDLGFMDAVNPRALLRMARRGLTEPVVLEALEKLESVAATPQHAAAGIARSNLARHYARCIHVAWLEEDPYAAAITRTLLDRLEGPLSTPPATPGITIAFVFLVVRAIQDPADAAVESESAYRLSPDSAVGKMLSAIIGWIGADKRRETELLRVVADSLLTVKRRQENIGVRILLDLLALPLARQRDGQSTTAAHGLSLPKAYEALSIAGVSWPNTPLAEYGLVFGDHKAAYIELIDRAIDALSNDAQNVLDSELWLRVEIDLPDGSRIPFRAPVEALLLRASPEVGANIALDYARAVSPNDGGYARLLRTLAEQPQDKTIRTAVARRAIDAPWRWIRRDATRLFRWGQPVFEFPQQLESLRDLLSEVPWTETDETEAVWRRASERDFWIERGPDEIWDMLQLWGEVPGSTQGAAALRLVRGFPATRTMGWARRILAEPEHHPAGRLALALLVARLVAAGHRTVELNGVALDTHAWLRGQLPELIRAVADEAPQQTLAAVEVDVLRVCQFVLIRLPAKVGFASRAEMMWLLFRLHGWLIHQLETQSSKRRAESYQALVDEMGKLPLDEDRWPDAFDPRHHSNVQRYRTLVVLNGLADITQLVAQAHESRVAFDPATDELLDTLLELAQQSLTEDELERSSISPVSHLWWRMPSSMPALALQTLLHFDASRWSQLAEGTREQWFTALHDFDGPLGQNDRHLLWKVIAANAESMNASERQQACGRLQAIEAWSPIQTHAWLNLAFIDPLDVNRAEAPIRTIDEERSRMLLFGRLLCVRWKREPSSIASEINALIERVQTANEDPVPVALGAAALMALSDPNLVKTVAAVLRKLLAREPFCNDERMNSIRSVVSERA